MHLDWSADGRPAWNVHLVFQQDRPDPAYTGRVLAIQVERAIAATGVGRAPKLRVGGGQVLASVRVKAVDDDDAAYVALCVLDTAVSQVKGFTLGELIARRATIQQATRYDS